MLTTRRTIIFCLLLALLWLGTTPMAVRASETTIRADDLAAAIAAAMPGAEIIIDGGEFTGTLVIEKPITLIGQNWPTINGGGQGSVVTIAANDVTIKGFIIRDSGRSLDEENAGIAVTAENAVISDNRFVDTLFGIYLKEAHGSTVQNNDIRGKDLDVPRRGDPIRVWSSNDVLIADNVVVRGRDVVLWYSERLTVRGNDVRDGRYGLHFMYCDDAQIEYNRLLDNSVGAFLMYSRRMNLRHNTIAGNRGPSGYGIGMKDMDDAILFENMFLDNRIGAHLDASPREVDSIGRFQGNVFAYNDIGIELLPSVRHNEFTDNAFIDNEEQVAIAGGGQPGLNWWTPAGNGNYWSDYAGFDVDGDGRGDIEYQSDRLFENLLSRLPELRFFIFSPATDAVDFAGTSFPIMRPQPKLIDSQPLMAPVIPTAAPPLPEPGGADWPLVAALLLGGALTLIQLPRFQWRRYQLPATRPSLMETGQ